MKRERAVVEHRRSQILEALKKSEKLEVETLASEWGVSPLTIRRDLQHLEAEQKIERFYGGAVVMKPAKHQKSESCMYTDLIARHAASLVEDGDSIFINTSMTALKVVRYLGDKRVTVITNNGRIMNTEVPPNVSIVLSGGELRYPKYAMVGEFSVRNLENVTVKKSFMGCSGLSVQRGMTTEIMNEVRINRLMFEHVSGQAYILADFRKIGRDSSFVSQDIENITHVITDEKAPQEEIENLRERNIWVHQVRKD